VNLDALARRLTAAVLICAALVFCAGPWAAPAGAQVPVRHAQPPLAMEPVEIATARGVFRFQAEIARRPREQEVGLMYRPALAPDRAMLFELGAPAEQAFWMKNCPVPIDMLFIEADGTVRTIARDAPPFSETPIGSGGPVTAVLEIRGGRAAEIGVQPGDKVRHPYFGHG
jgi:uncharacterized membrane protein (UPF0127 family)